MAELRFWRGWSNDELVERLAALQQARRNFARPADPVEADGGWHHYYSEAVIARERPGPPEEGGPFERASVAITNYRFSDPEIVMAHFEPESALLGRRLLLELRALHVFRYLGGVVISVLREERGAGQTVFGFRYETLEGHIEQGAEWFLLTKNHDGGEIRFRIEAAWRPGDFPNWWSRIGFSILGRYYQKRWHRRAHAALAVLARDPDLSVDPERNDRVVQPAPKVIFKRSEVRHVG